MNFRAFTFIELLIVIAIIVILSLIAVQTYPKMLAKSRLSRVSVQLADTANAITQYAQDNGGNYPGSTAGSFNEIGRGVPAGLGPYLPNGNWPIGPWPHGVFDWDDFTNLSDNKPVHQLSYHFCSSIDPIDYCTEPILFPNFSRYSSIFYCIDGSCVPSQSHPNDPGWQTNAKKHEVNY